MKRSSLLGVGIMATPLFVGLNGLRAQQSDKVDVAGYPPEVQQQYKLLEQKCSRCHDLSRPLTAKYTSEAQWHEMVARMARKPGAGISRKDQAEITAFLVFRQRGAAGGAAPAPAGATGKAAASPAALPPEVERQHKLFAEKCSRCHDLSRPLTAKYTSEAQWREMVARMARKPGAGINRKDQEEITAFLLFNQKSRSGTATPVAAAGTAVTPVAAGEAPPATRAEGSATGGGLRVEVDALPAQSIVAPVDGKWTTEAPGAGENLFLCVRLFDETTGEKVPYAKIRARVGGDDSQSGKELRPLFGGKGFQYGGNFVAPAGDLQVSLAVEPPALARVSDDGHRWNGPLNLKLTLSSR